MRNTIFAIEFINALLGIGSYLNNNLLGLSKSNLNLIVLVIFIGGFLGLFISERELENRITQNVLRKVFNENSELINPEPQIGTLDSVTDQDRRLIFSMQKNLILRHGHIDLDGMLADRASGVPLNELMSKNCWCGMPRNQRSRRG